MIRACKREDIMLDETLAQLETNIRASEAIQADKKAKLLRLKILVPCKSETYEISLFQLAKFTPIWRRVLWLRFRSTKARRASPGTSEYGKMASTSPEHFRHAEWQKTGLHLKNGIWCKRSTSPHPHRSR